MRFSPKLRLTQIYLAAILFLVLISITAVWELLPNTDGSVLIRGLEAVTPDGNIGAPTRRLFQILVISLWLIFFVSSVDPTTRLCRISQPPDPAQCTFWWWGSASSSRSKLWACLTYVASVREYRHRRRAVLVFGPAWLAVILLFLGLEEISYGQLFFDWQTSGFFAEHNYQQETNLHNLFNPLNWALYQVFAMALGTVLVVGQTPGLRRTVARLGSGAEALIPAPGYAYLAIAFVVAANSDELFEEIFAAFALFYSLDILRAVSQRAVAT